MRRLFFTLHFALLLVSGLLPASGQTPVLYRALDCTGTSNNLPVTFQNLLRLQVGQQAMIVGLPVTVTPTNGQFTTTLTNGLYNMTVQGISGGALVLIPDSASTQSVHLCIVSNIGTFTRTNLGVIITNRLYVDPGTNTSIRTNGFHFIVDSTGGGSSYNTTQFRTNNSAVDLKPGALATNVFLYDNQGHQYWFTNGALVSDYGGAQIGNPLALFQYYGDGSQLTGLNASSLASGTVPVTRLGSGTANSTTYYRGDQTFQTLNATAIPDFNAVVTNIIHTNYSDTVWDKTIALVFCGDSLTATNYTGWPPYLTNSAGPWSNAPVGFATNTAIGSDLAGNIWTNYDTRIGQYILASTSATTNVYLFIWAGINDIGITGGHLGATNAITSLSNIWWKARYQGAKVVAFTISDSQFFTTQDQYERDNLNRMIRASGRNGTNGWDYLVDIDNYLSAATSGSAGIPSWMDNTIDGVHFTTNNFYQIAKLVDWSMRNGTRANAPFPRSKIDATRAIGAASLWYPNTFRRKITIQGNDYLNDNDLGLYGLALEMQDPDHYVGVIIKTPNMSEGHWVNGVTGQMGEYYAPDYTTGFVGGDALPYRTFTYPTKTHFVRDHLQTPEAQIGSAIFTNSFTNLALTASKLVLTDANKKIVSSSFTDTDFVPKSLTNVYEFALSDEITAITTGTAKVTWRTPFAMTITGVRASLTTASSSGLPTVNIKESGTTIFSTKLTIDANELTSTTAATAAVISDSSLADDAEITFDIDVAGTGAKGLKVKIFYTR